MRREATDGSSRGGAAPPESGGVRLNKLLASRGLGARRKCDALIQAGSVRVNGTVVKEPGTQVMPDRDRVEVHGRPIPGRAALRYLMVNKPVGVITTLDDPEGRPTVGTLLPPGPRMFPVGRLDAETSGLIIATNDGALAHHLMHPRYGVRKVYRARLDRPPDAQQIRRLREGVEFEPKIVSAPCEVRVHSARPDRAEIEIVLHEGRYRQVRRMCEAVGLRVVRLHRPAYGPLTLGELPRGAWRELTPDEVRRLKAASARPVARARTLPPSRRASDVAPAPRARPLPRLARSPGRARGAAPRSHSGRPLRGPDRVPERSSRPGRSERAGGRPARALRPERSERARTGAAPGPWPGRLERSGRRPARASRPGQSAGRGGRTSPRPPRRDAGASRGGGAGRPKTGGRRFGGRRTTY